MSKQKLHDFIALNMRRGFKHVARVSVVVFHGDS